MSENHRFTRASSVDRTSCQGYVRARYRDIVKLLGPPHMIGSGDDKTKAEWWLEFPCGTVATLYDWKEECLPTEWYDWHIGGHSNGAVALVTELLVTPVVD